MPTTKRPTTRSGSPSEEGSFQKLLHCAQALHSSLERGEVAQTLAASSLEVFGAPLAAVLLREGERLHLRALAAENARLERSFRDGYASGACSAVERLARRAMSSRLPVCAEVEVSGVDLQAQLPSGQALAATLLTSRCEGALVVFAGPDDTPGEREQSLLAAVANVGAMAIANAELYATAASQARELKQLLEISSELGTISQLEKFLERFVVRAAQFLGFRRAYIALRRGAECDIRWCAVNGRAQPIKMVLKTQVSMKVLASKKAFWSDDAREEPEAEIAATGTPAKQYLAVPLLGPGADVLGILGVLDREDETGITAEDVRRATALASEVAVALEAAQAIHISEQHRGRAESLMSLALEMGSSLRLPDFVKSFTVRATDMMGARAGALALAQGAQLETVMLHDPAVAPERSLLRQLNLAFTDFAANRTQPMVSGSASEVLEGGLASKLGWKDVTLARLTGADGELIGVLCLADRHAALNEEDRNLLQALGGHASVALENSRLFSRITQASHQWAEIFDAITDFIVVHDEGNKVLRVNRSLAEFIGVPPPELIGVSMRAMVAIATEAGGQPCPFCRAGMDVSDEYIHPVLERTYLVSTSRIHGALNEGLQTIHVLKDITDRREAERRYRELFDNVQEGIYFSSPEGRFVEVNDALVRMLGYESREELLQVDIPTQVYLSPGKRLEFRQALENAGAIRNYEELLRRKDGSLMYTLQNAFAVRDAAGRVVQYRGVVLDVTEQKEFQAQLQRERDFNSKILNNTQSMILVLDTAGLVSYGNRRCFEAGAYKSERLLGHRLIDFVPGGRKEALADAFEATLRGEQVDNLEVPLVRGDGRIGHFSVNLSPMRDEQGNISSIVVVMTDITDAALLQAKLMHAEKMAAVGQLVSGVAHEVNNPLTAILGFADLLIESPGMPESARKDLNVILQEAQRTKVIVQNLLSFARQSAPQREPLQLNHILRRTVQLRSYDFSSHGVEVVEELHDGLPDVVGDSQQLQQVFLNILNNAYDAVREAGRRGHIEIRTSSSDDHVYVSFSDNGNGISNPDRIFDPFFTTKEVGKGTGLGLSICYGILREHGGEITCHNNPNAMGATFIVKLPAASKTIAAAISAGVQR